MAPLNQMQFILYNETQVAKQSTAIIPIPNNALASGFQANIANLSTVPITKVGFS